MSSMSEAEFDAIAAYDARGKMVTVCPTRVVGSSKQLRRELRPKSNFGKVQPLKLIRV